MTEFSVMIDQLMLLGEKAEQKEEREEAIFAVPAQEDKRMLTCNRCGKSLPVVTSFYIRKSDTPGHPIGAVMQPCKPCSVVLKRAYRERVKLEKLEKGVNR